MEYDDEQQSNQQQQGQEEDLQDDSGNGVGNGGQNDNRERDRDRRGRGQRGTRFSDADGGGRERSRERRNCRIYVSNIPYDYRWQDLKDLFRRVVGSVEYVELFSDESGKPRGCGIVEFKDPDNVALALEKMNRYEINGREIVVKEDHGENRDQYGRIIREGGGVGSGGGGGVGAGVGRGDRGGDRNFVRRGDREDDRISGRHMGMGGGSVGGGMGPNDYDMPYNTYGLSTSFLESLGINGPLHTKVFVANLDYKVDAKKLKQVFKLAGKVQSVDLSVDKEGNSRGFAVIEYDHPVEAVQAISMFDRQMLYDRRMTVRLDRIPDKSEGIKLPEGLGGIGIGLGPNGEPLRDVARNLPNMTQQNQVQSANMIGGGSNMGGGGGGGGNLGGGGSMGANMNQNQVPVPVAPPINNPQANILGAVASNPSVLSSLSSSNLAALSNVVGGLKNLAGVGAALSNPLLSSGLSNLGLNLGGGGSVASAGDVADQVPSAPVANNYSTGNSYNSGYTSTTFNSGGGGGARDFDQPSRNYNTNTQDGGGDFGSGAGGNMGGGNMGGGNMGGGYGNSPMGGGRKSDTIVIKNIPLSCTWQTLRDKFRDIGEVKFAEIRGNDVGVVRFFKEKDAELAIKLMDGSRMDGRTVSVSFF